MPINLTLLIEAPFEFILKAGTAARPTKFLLLLLVLVWIQAGQLDRIQQFLDLVFGKNFFLTNDFEKSFARLVRFTRKLGCFLVADYGIQRGYDADGSFQVILQ